MYALKLYTGAKTRVRVGSDHSEEFCVNVGVHQGSVLSPLLFAIIVGVVTEFAREELLYELLYVYDLGVISETIENPERETLEVEKGICEQKKLTLGKKNK